MFPPEKAGSSKITFQYEKFKVLVLNFTTIYRNKVVTWPQFGGINIKCLSIFRPL